MSLSKAEAEDALGEIDRVIARTRRAVATGCCGGLLILWGVIWLLGFSASQFLPDHANYLWAALDSAGFLASWFLGARSQRSTRGGFGLRIGLSWLALFLYATLWLFILRPSDWRFFGAYPATLAMFGYVLMGLWLDRYLLWLGLAVTAASLLGILCVPDWFNLWMGVIGGGSLIAAGIHIRKSWN